MNKNYIRIGWTLYTEDVYGNYLLWAVALALFNALLPYKPKNIFEDK